MFEVKMRDFDLPAMQRYDDRFMTGYYIKKYEQYGPIRITEHWTEKRNGEIREASRTYYQTQDEGHEEFDYDFRVVLRS